MEPYIVKYDTLEECMQAYFGETNIPHDGYWTWWDSDNVEHKMPMDEAVKKIEEKKVWGWVENKTFVHIFIGSRASEKNIIELLAHELGHLERPYHRSLAEETKANRYSKVAVTAFNILRDIQEKKDVIVGGV